MIDKSVRNAIEWGIVGAVSVSLIVLGFVGGKRLNDKSWIDLNLPACVPTEVVKKINTGGACDMDSFDIGTLIEYDNRVFAVTEKKYFSWKNDGPNGARELKLEFKERKSDRK